MNQKLIDRQERQIFKDKSKAVFSQDRSRSWMRSGGTRPVHHQHRHVQTRLSLKTVSYSLISDEKKNGQGEKLVSDSLYSQ